MSKTQSKSKRRSPDQWKALVDQYRNSGLSARRFCAQHNIGYASFCNWRQRVGEQTPGQSGPSDRPAAFIDLSALAPARAPSPWHIVLSLGDGVELRLSRG